MEKHFDIPRRRIKPKRAALVAVFRDSQQLTYGVVTNLSLTGACIVTDSPLAPGSDVDLKLSFYHSPDLYEIGARVVWNRRGGPEVADFYPSAIRARLVIEAREKGFEGLELHGVRFMLSSIQKSRLYTILDGEDFVDIYRVQRDAVQKALSGELDEPQHPRCARPLGSH